MTKLEKVLLGLRACQCEEGKTYTQCMTNGCPYSERDPDYPYYICTDRLHMDTIAVLDELRKTIKQLISTAKILDIALRRHGND